MDKLSLLSNARTWQMKYNVEICKVAHNRAICTQQRNFYMVPKWEMFSKNGVQKSLKANARDSE